MKRIVLLTVVVMVALSIVGCDRKPKSMVGEIAFTSSMDKDGAHDIYVIELPSLQTRQLTKTEGDGVENIWIDWSLAGKITFASTRDGNYELYMINPDGSGETRLTENNYFDGYPTLRWDGKQLAYSSSPPPRRGMPQKDIYIMDLSTKKSRNITNSPEDETCSRFSPDGKLLAYCRYVRGQSEIFVYDMATGKSTQITDNTAEDINPVWTPNSLYIIFSSTRNDSVNVAENKRFSIFLASLQDGSVEELVDEKYMVGGASVSPNSQWLAYHHLKREDWLDIAIRDLATEKDYVLVKNIFFNRDPVWNPRSAE